MRPMFGPSGVSIGTDAAVVGRMNVADFESGAIAGETSWPKGRQTALVGEFGERVRLIHELAQL
jgi:hypothetical protein